MSFQIKPLSLNKKDKRGVSVMIGYVLLVAFAVIIGVITYGWIKTYVPVESIDCGDGISAFIDEAEYNPLSNNLTITLENNGRFSFDGFFIRAKNDSSQEIANIDIGGYHVSGGETLGNAVLREGGIKPNGDFTSIFNLPESIGEPLSVTIIPFQYKVFGNRERLVSCGDSQVSQNVDVMYLLYVFAYDVGGLTGDFNGLGVDGIDSACITASTGTRIEDRNFTAWISTDDLNAKDKIPDGIYVLPPNTSESEPTIIVANSKDDLLDGTLSHEIDRRANGDIAGSAGGLWTGTDEFGNVLDDNCNNWTSSSSSVSGARGRSTETNFGWTNYGNDSCSDGGKGIYCFETI